MNRSKSNSCNDERLRTLLTTDEHSSEYRQNLKHVDSCDQCQLRLEQIAADQDVWQQSSEGIWSRLRQTRR